ncbi:MAG: hypothetical protein V2A79_02830 [Planctomycetota bacterium]
MELITNKSELTENIGRLKQYLQKAGVDQDFALALIRNGICFVVTEDNANPYVVFRDRVGEKKD